MLTAVVAHAFKSRYLGRGWCLEPKSSKPTSGTYETPRFSFCVGGGVFVLLYFVFLYLVVHYSIHLFILSVCVCVVNTHTTGHVWMSECCLVGACSLLPLMVPGD